MPIQQHKKVAVLCHNHRLFVSRCAKDIYILCITKTQIADWVRLNVKRRTDPSRYIG